MPPTRHRACLQSGLKLDLNRLVRQGAIRPGCFTGGRTLRWSWSYTGEHIATATIDADMRDAATGWLRIVIGGLSQTIDLEAKRRHFGGRQWYFRCPVKGGLASVVWMPPGARRFASRQAWGRQVAYASQFETPHGRALTMAQRLRTQLAGPEWAPLDGTDPPKPKWMRWATYNRIMERCDRYEAIADARLIIFAARWLKAG
jgi:hypothetical protein